MAEQTSPPVLDYEGSTYRTDFWEGQGREYEDRVERIAIRRLLPESGCRLLELGAGFGRLTPLFEGYEQVVLLDYSRSQLEYARERYGDDGFIYVAGNIYEMPFAPGVFDTATLVRVLHHLSDPPAVFKAIRSLLRKNGTFLLEFANKRNIKAILRWWLRRQDWNPFTPEPVEFVELHYDFHPRYIREKLAEAGLTPGRMLTVSHFRIGLLKRLIPAGILAAFDSVAQLTGNLWQLSPSVFVLNMASGEDQPAPEGAFWRCPDCGSYDLAESPEGLDCAGCNAHWPKINGVYSFKEED